MVGKTEHALGVEVTMNDLQTPSVWIHRVATSIDSLSSNVRRFLSVHHGLTLANLRSYRVIFVHTTKALTQIVYDVNRQFVYFTGGREINRISNSAASTLLFGLVSRMKVEEVVKSGGKVLYGRTCKKENAKYLNIRLFSY